MEIDDVKRIHLEPNEMLVLRMPFDSEVLDQLKSAFAGTPLEKRVVIVGVHTDMRVISAEADDLEQRVTDLENRFSWHTELHT